MFRLPGQQKYLAQLEDFKLTKYDELARERDKAVAFKEELEVENFHLTARVAQLEIEIEIITMQVKPAVAHDQNGGNKEFRTLAISPTFLEVLNRINASRSGGEAYVFTNPLTGTGYSRQSHDIKYLLQRVCKKAEVPLFTAYSIRHFVATHFNDPRRAQKILGHGNLKTTEIYPHDSGVDVGAASIFESITNKITNSDGGEKTERDYCFQ